MDATNAKEIDNACSVDLPSASATKENNALLESENSNSNIIQKQTPEDPSIGQQVEEETCNITIENQKETPIEMDSKTETVDHQNLVPSTQIKTEPTDDNAQPLGNENVTESFASVIVKSEQKPKLVGVRNFITKSSLGLLAQYDSDSDQDTNSNEQDKIQDDEVVEVPIEASKDYRKKVVEIDSESESDSSSDSDVEYIAKIRKEIEKRIDLEDDDDAEDDEDDESSVGKSKKKKGQNSMRVKGELGLEDLPPIQDLQITVPEEECIVLGKIHSIVDQLLLVSALPDSTLYDLETVLFLEKGKRVLGEVFDVLGPVADPLYCVRFNSHKDIEEKGLKVGDAVYVAPKTEHTQFVIVSSLMKMRGSDASWENDIEPPPRFLDYSDDEQEREARQRLRNKDRSASKAYEDHDDESKRARDELSDTASVSSVASSNQQSQTSFAQRGSRFNRGNANRITNDRNRPRYTNHRSPQQMPRHPNSGSWHSNYTRPYSYNQPHMPMPPMPLPMNPSYPPFPQYSLFPPMMPPLPPHAPTMYVPNPYAMRPPQFSPQVPLHPIQTRSPSPPPPGMDQ